MAQSDDSTNTPAPGTPGWLRDLQFDLPLEPEKAQAGCEQTIEFGRTEWTRQGAVDKKTQLKVKIPPGVEAGTRIRLRGQGEQDRVRSEASDLYLRIALLPGSGQTAGQTGTAPGRPATGNDLKPAVPPPGPDTVFRV